MNRYMRNKYFFYSNRGILAHTEPVVYSYKGMIKWTWELKAAYWQIRGGQEAMERSLEIIIDGATYLPHGQENWE